MYTEEIKTLKADPRLQRLADRMATGVEPWLVRELWTGVDDPIEWFAVFAVKYWRKERPPYLFPLEENKEEAVARAIIALYKEKRERVEARSR
jgi:hypothetical protein